MARAGALLLLVALLAATVCVSEVAASRQLTGAGVGLNVYANVQLTIGNECNHGVVVTLPEDPKNKKEGAKHKMVKVKKGEKGILGPCQVQPVEANFLYVQIALEIDELVAVVVKVDLSKAEFLVSGLVNVVLRLVVDVNIKVVTVLCGGEALGYITLPY